MKRIIKSSQYIQSADEVKNEKLQETISNLEDDFDFILAGLDKLDRTSAEDSRMALEIAEKFYANMQDVVSAISERF